MRRAAWALLVTLTVLSAWIARPAAHDLPADVVVQTFIKPEGRELHVLLRVPLAAMGDVDYPTRGPAGLLDLSRVDPALREAVEKWLTPGLTVLEDGAPAGPPKLSAVRISLPSDRSFATYDTALANVRGPALPADTTLYSTQGWLDALIDYDIRSERASLAIRPAFARLGVRVVTATRFLVPDGNVRAFEWIGDPGEVRLDPGWYQAAWQFVKLGFTHILSGADHLLFLICLVIPVRRLRSLIPVVSAFAIAHSITLVASAFDMAPDALWFPPLIEMLIAVSIVYMALENMLAARFERRWIVAFGFGLVHGFGFSFALRESLQFAGSHLLLSLLAFNLGVELGQILVLVLVIPPLVFLFRRVASERMATIVLSALVAHTAWHWMIDRGRDLTAFRFTWPRLDAAFGAKATGWLLIAAGAAVVLRVLSRLAKRLQSREPRVQASPAAADSFSRSASIGPRN
jgi:hypothetical protein